MDIWRRYFAFWGIIGLMWQVNTIKAQTDSPVIVLTPAEYSGIVKKYHPVVKQARMMPDKAGAELSSTRGAFDPKLKAYSDQKTFDGLNYFHYWNTEINIPTWYGINIYGGLQHADGEKINPEKTVGTSNYLGISIPLGKNLILDRRRASLQQAKLFLGLSVQEQNNMINDLLMDALYSYWIWAETYQQYLVMNKAVEINEQRYNFIRLGLAQGDRAAIDTTEAYVQLQNFYFLRSEAYLKLKNAMLEVSNYLWLENNIPYQISETVLPDTSWNKIEVGTYEIPVLDSILNVSRSNHPKLLSFDFKLRGLEIERKYKKQNLLPEINLKSSILGKEYTFIPESFPGQYEQNNTFGVFFSLPLRLSEARGEYRQSVLKISETEFEQRLQKLEIENKVRQYANELAMLKSQIILFEQMLVNNNKLLRAEDGRFRAGESSLFLVNNRENRVVETNQKLLALKGKFFKTAIALQWAGGLLYLPD